MAVTPAEHLRVRRARPDDAAALSELALRSKGYWGYDAAFLEACRHELTVLPGEVEHRRTAIAVDGSDRAIGFYTLEGTPPGGELGMLFVERQRIGTGVGRLLWSHMVERATTLGFGSVRIEADPGAASFYEAMGARIVGTTSSGSIPGRHLPLLVLDISAASPLG